MPSDHPMALEVALYLLYYIDDLAGFGGLSERQLRTLPDDKGPLVESLQWALANPDYDFHGVLPGIRQRNSDILHYLEVLLLQLTS